jgi:phosphoglycolate phosphatase
VTAPARVWLFDIDGTLVDTGGAGLCALSKAAEDCFGGRAPFLDLHGSTDLGVVEGILAHYGEAYSPEKVEGFFSRYHICLEQQLAGRSFPGKVLPGVSVLLERLARDERNILGLLTGNTELGAAIKLRHYELDSYFSFGAYGSDHADRNLLGPIALSRGGQLHSVDFQPREAIVVGDTPKDVACAKALGSPCLAVATGKFSKDDLLACGADWAVESLEVIPAGLIA